MDNSIRLFSYAIASNTVQCQKTFTSDINLHNRQNILKIYHKNFVFKKKTLYLEVS